MGLRDALTATLQPELHRCTPRGMQPCNSQQNSATPGATVMQLTRLLTMERAATAGATPAQQASCTPNDAVQPDATELHDPDPRVVCIACRHYHRDRCGNWRRSMLGCIEVGPALAALRQHCPGFAAPA
jgi:hypothetical protein